MKLKGLLSWSAFAFLVCGVPEARAAELDGNCNTPNSGNCINSFNSGSGQSLAASCSTDANHTCLSVQQVNSGTGPGIRSGGVGGAGVYGVSVFLNGVEGHSLSGAASGVYGENTGAGYGVAGRIVPAGNGNAIFGDNSSTAANAWAGNFNGKVNITGDLHVGGAAFKPFGGEWQGSDSRLKKEIKALDLGLTELQKVHTVRFKYNGLGGTKDDGIERVGVIAQELEKILPMMVSTRKIKLHNDDPNETEVKFVDPSEFTFLLINAVQEQQKIIEQQAKEMSGVKDRISTVERRRGSTLSWVFGDGLPQWAAAGLIPLGYLAGLKRRKRQ